MEEVQKHMNDGTIKYEGYAGTYTKGRGLKNNRTKKRQVIRRRENEARREAEALKKIKEYSKNENFNQYDYNED